MFNLYGADGYKPSSDFVQAYTAQFSYRYHSGVYEKWAKKRRGEIDLLMCVYEGFGNFKIQKHLYIEGSDFVSVGNDPILLFQNPNIVPGNRYWINMVLSSSIDSVVQVFYQLEGDKSFSEESSIKKQVVKGDNTLVIELPLLNLRPILRIDPLRSPGRFKFKHLSLEMDRAL